MYLLSPRSIVLAPIVFGMLLSACGPGAAPAATFAPTFTPAVLQASPTSSATTVAEQSASPTAAILPATATAPSTAAPSGVTPVPTSPAPSLTTPPTTVPAALPGNAANGEKLFDSLPCSSCHDDTHPFPGGIVCPNLGNIATEAARIVKSPDYHGTATDAAGYIHESIVNPNAYIVPGPNYHSSDGQSAMEKDFAKILTPAQIDDLVAYLMTKQ